MLKLIKTQLIKFILNIVSIFILEIMYISFRIYIFNKLYKKYNLQSLIFNIYQVC